MTSPGGYGHGTTTSNATTTDAATSINTGMTTNQGEGGGIAGGGGGVGTRPRYLIVCLWRRLLASRHCSF